MSPRLWSCCPEPGSESRFRIRPEPWAAAWWGEILLPQFPGSLTLRPGLVAVVHSSSGSHCPRDTLAFQPRALAFQPWALTEVDPAPSGKNSKRWRPGSGGDAYKNLPTIEEDTQSSTPSYTDNTVGQASAYFYQVVALRADGESQKSITIDVTTPAESIRSVPQRSTAPATQTLVSNTDRATVSMANLITQDLAQEFTTGPNPTGYKLSSIDLYLTGRGTDLTVKLFSGSATGSEVATLTSPGWDTTCIRSFLPPTPI